MMKKSLIYLSISVLLIGGCARSVAVEPAKLGDTQLTCSQLLSEIEEAEQFRKAAEDNKGVTGTNAAAVLLFWPALFVTYSDANEAIRAADERKANLMKLYSDSHCNQPSL